MQPPSTKLTSMANVKPPSSLSKKPSNVKPSSLRHQARAKWRNGEMPPSSLVQGVHGAASPATSRRSFVVCSPLRHELAPPSSFLLSCSSRCVKGRITTVRPPPAPPLSPAKSSIVSAATRIGVFCVVSRLGLPWSNLGIFLQVSWTKYEEVVGDEGTYDLAHDGDGEASRFGYAN
ncbi:hypothetical protein V8G54_000677 [Vigna mungo]|uniref:Uncharacterized protein n=1 Tax=Vigna mungo TaxID=3915 RepID=A0AAQ3P945_VIGMU